MLHTSVALKTTDVCSSTLKLWCTHFVTKHQQDLFSFSMTAMVTQFNLVLGVFK